MNSVIIFLASALVSSLSLPVFYKQRTKSIQKYTDSIIKEAHKESERLKSLSEEQIKFIQDNIKELDSDHNEIIPDLESKLNNKQLLLDKRQNKLNILSEKLSNLTSSIKDAEIQKKTIISQVLEQLSGKANANIDDIVGSLESGLEAEFANHFEKDTLNYLNSLEDTSVRKGQEIVKVVMQKYAEPSSTDKLDKIVETLSPKEAIRISGENNQNFDYISEKLNVDIEISEYEPNLVKVSGFILWKQEAAKRVVEKLTQLRSINFEMIDKLIAQFESEIDKELIKIGAQVVKDIQLDNKDPEFLKVLGRLQYRTSYGQNILFHSFEVGYFSQMLASLLGEDPRKAFLAGFFHDVGKAIDQEQEGTHDLLGKQFLEQHGFDFEIYHPAHSHHHLVPVETTIGEIVIIADKISASRPGARSESAEMYFERVKGLERIAKEEDGVKKAFAISAGREIRTFVDETKTSDQDMSLMAENIAHKIEDELTYPGSIKVNLIRSFKAVDHANKQK